MTQQRRFPSELAWKRMFVRSELGISGQTPWFALACTTPKADSFRTHRPNPSPHPNATKAIPWLRDLVWHGPEAHLGAIALHSQHSGALPHPMGWGALSATVPTSLVLADAGDLLDWLCATDGWLLWGDSPLDKAILDVANTLDLPTLNMDQPSIDAEPLWLAFQRRSVRSVPWIQPEVELERSLFVLEQAIRSDASSEATSNEGAVRHAA